MLPKPKHLAPEYAEQFKDSSVVEAYCHRPSYPVGLSEILLDLMDYEPYVALDVGCGTGSFARPLAICVERVDAVDFSQAMNGTPGRIG
jgi:predicted TPR repeat methyltransferase